jgi:hypothetical protein
VAPNDVIPAKAGIQLLAVVSAGRQIPNYSFGLKRRRRVFMQLTPTQLLRMSGEALARFLQAAPNFEIRQTPGASLVLSGEPVADLNYAFDLPPSMYPHPELGCGC